MHKASPRSCSLLNCCGKPINEMVKCMQYTRIGNTPKSSSTSTMAFASLCASSHLNKPMNILLSQL